MGNNGGVFISPHTVTKGKTHGNQLAIPDIAHILKEEGHPVLLIFTQKGIERLVSHKVSTPVLDAMSERKTAVSRALE